MHGMLRQSSDLNQVICSYFSDLSEDLSHSASACPMGQELVSSGVQPSEFEQHLGHRTCNSSAAHRYGTMPAQFKAFWDATGGLWKNGSLLGKPVGLFTSTASQGGGQESTILTCESADLSLVPHLPSHLHPLPPCVLG